MPTAEMLAHSLRLKQHICDKIQAKGSISFAEYFDLTQYAPGLGYYTAGMQKFGAKGDFITAPELGDAFATCLANVMAPCLISLSNLQAHNPSQPVVVMEIGCGSGQLAIDLLLHLAEHSALPDWYYLLERSADLRERQQALANTLLSARPELLARMMWLDKLPAENSFIGVIVGNEVLDALAVERFETKAGKALQLRVGLDAQGEFGYQLGEALALPLAIQASVSDLPEGYQSEFCAMLPSWLGSVANGLSSGMVIWIDYGFPRSEYYHPARRTGTLIGHYQQRCLDAPFWWPGLIDLSASVDFTWVAEAAQASGLELLGYQTQSEFLLRTGLTDLARSVAAVDSRTSIKRRQELKLLTLPQEMGERFQVMALSKALAPDATHPVFSHLGMRHRL